MKHYLLTFIIHKNENIASNNVIKGVRIENIQKLIRREQNNTQVN